MAYGVRKDTEGIDFDELRAIGSERENRVGDFAVYDRTFIDEADFGCGDGKIGVDRLAQILAEKPTVKEKPDARPLSRFSTAIRFRDVSFAYQTQTVVADMVLCPLAEVTQHGNGDVGAAHHAALEGQGNTAGALKSYREDLATMDRLAKADPGNTGWQRDLASSYGRIAQVLAQQGESALALDAFRQGRAIIAPLEKASPDNALLHNDLAYFDTNIANLQGDALKPSQAAR